MTTRRRDETRRRHDGMPNTCYLDNDTTYVFRQDPKLRPDDSPFPVCPDDEVYCDKTLPYFSYFKQQLMFLKKTDFTYVMPLFRSLFDLYKIRGI